MSARCTAAVFDRYPAGGGEFTLALALADNAHEDGTRIFPSVETMAQKSRQSVRSVQRFLREMIASGWLRVVKNAGGGRGVNVEYRIDPDWLKGANLAPFSGTPDDAKKGANLAPFSGSKGCQPAHKRVPSDAQKGASQGTPYITTRTSIEPPLPPKGEARGFEDFIAGYPRQVDLAKAWREWSRIAPSAQLQCEIARAVQAWIRSPEWQREGGRYIPKPGNWLRGERWRDVPGIAAPPPSPVAPPAPAAPAAPMPEEVRAKIASMLGHKRRKPSQHQVEHEGGAHADAGQG